MNRSEFEELELQVQQSDLPLKLYLQQVGVSYSRVYYNICIIKYFLDIISPGNDMLAKMKNLFHSFPEIDLAAMGFPQGWESEPL